MVTALLFLLTVQEDAIPRLIELLADESIDLRQDAATRLAAIGRPAIPALRKAADGPDAQRSGAARDVLGVIAERLRVEEFRPPLLRRDLRFEREPFERAVARTAEAFGLEPPVCDETSRGKRVSLELKKATLWESLDALAGAVDADLGGLLPQRPVPCAGTRLMFQTRTPRPSYLQHVNHEDVRVYLDACRVSRDSGGRWASLQVVLALPPRAWVEAVRFSDLRVTLNDRVVEPAKIVRSSTRPRLRGFPTRVTAGTLVMPFPVGPERNSFGVQGVLILDLPDRVEDVPARDGAPHSLQAPFASVTGEWRQEAREYVVFAQGESGPDGLAFQVAARDIRGDWLCDLPFTVRPRMPFQLQHREPLNAEPAGIAAWRVTRTVERRIPLRFPAIEVSDFR